MKRKKKESGILGIEFVEWGLGGGVQRARKMLDDFGVVRLAKVKGRAIDVFSGGGIQVLLNSDPNGYAATYSAMRGGSAIVSIGVRVADAFVACQRAIEGGAWPVGEFLSPDLPFPAVLGPEDVLIYFVEDVSVAGTGAHTLDIEAVEDGRPLARVLNLRALEMRDEATRAEWESWFVRALGLRRREALEHDFEFVDALRGKSHELAFGVSESGRNGSIMRFSRDGAVLGLSVVGDEAPDLRRLRRRWAGVFDGLPAQATLSRTT